MDLTRLFSDIEIDEIVNIFLTAIIAFSVYSQARSTQEQAKNTRNQVRKLEDAQQRLAEKDRPNVKFTSLTQIVEGSTFVGFSMTNASMFDITITSVALELGIPENIKGSFAQSISPTPIDVFKGTRLSELSLPRRLQYGDSIRVLYDEARIVHLMESYGKEQPARARPRCHDSLGNRHTMDYWITWFHGGSSAFPDPGPGLITEEKWLKKPR